MSETLNTAKKRLQSALTRLETVVEMHDNERNEMRKRIVELEAANHDLKAEINMLMRLQEQFIASRASGVQYDDISVDKKRIVNKSKAELPLTLAAEMPNSASNDPGIVSDEMDVQSVGDGMAAAALSIKDFKAIARKVK